jgi:hypothetical protein
MKSISEIASVVFHFTLKNILKPLLPYAFDLLISSMRKLAEDYSSEISHTDVNKLENEKKQVISGVK